MFRNFCFTINNYTEDSCKELKEVSSYLIYGQEIAPTTGTPHLQGYCELKKRTRFKRLKRIIPTAHIEKRKGTAQEAADYCKKELKYVEYGTISMPGRRTDILNLYSAVKEGKSNIDIMDAHPQAMYKYYRAVNMHRHLELGRHREFIKPEVIVIWGEAGTGKTKKAYADDPDLYDVMHNSDTLWWDGYEGQKTILFDDFYGGVKYSLMLKLLDGYPLQLAVKGGHTWKRWRKVYITSNKPPRLWYSQGLTPALSRRISKEERLGNSITPNLWNTVDFTEQPLEQENTSGTPVNFTEKKSPTNQI